MRFRASVDLHGKTATGIVVPPEVVDGLGDVLDALAATVRSFASPPARGSAWD